MIEKHLRAFPARLMATILCVLLGVGSNPFQLQAKTKQGDKYLKQAEQAELEKKWDQAADLYQKALNEDPKDVRYSIGSQKARFQAAQEHLHKGRDFRTAGNLAEAIAEFQRAIMVDPSQSIAMQELKRTQDLLHNPPGPDADLTPAERNDRDVQARSESILGLPELAPTVKRVGPLKMNNQPVNILYNTLASLAGVNVVWDATWTRPTPSPTSQPRSLFDVDMPELSIEQALDYIGLVTHTFWKPLTPTTIFITDESDNKRRDYEDLVVKTFFLTNAASQNEFLELTTAIRSITDIRRVYPYNALRAVVVRGRADEVALAEKLARDLDRPKSEVVVDVMIMTANSTHTRDLAATIASAGVAGISSGINFAPRAGITTPAAAGATPAAGTNVTLAQLGRLSSGDFNTSLPGALLNAIVNDSTTRVLTNPQVRASDGQKVTLNIGDRVPVASGSFQTGVGGTAAGVNTQFQYINVGVNVDITPQIHSANEVTLQVDLEVSSIKNTVTVGNSSNPVIGQDKATANLRLREGEINILAGLSTLQNSESNNGIPGLINIPVLGKYLFGANHVEKDKGELMIALIPHIVRTPDYSPESLRGVYAGFEGRIKLLRAPKFDKEPAAATGAPAPAAPPTSNSVPGATSAPTTGPVNTPPATAPPVTTAPQAGIPPNSQLGIPLPTVLPPGVPGGPTPPGQPPATAPPANGPKVSFQPGALNTARNTPFNVDVRLDNAVGATGLSTTVSWDPSIFRLNDIVAGDLMSRDGQRITAVKSNRNDIGQATLSITRPTDAAPVSGSGVAATLTFVAIGPTSGSGRITVTEMGLTDAASKPINATPGSIAVAIQ